MALSEENIHKLKYPGAVDADGHILESAKCWEEYCEAKYRANAIRLKEDKEGLEYLEVNGVPSRVNRGWRTQRPGRNHRYRERCDGHLELPMGEKRWPEHRF